MVLCYTYYFLMLGLLQQSQSFNRLDFPVYSSKEKMRACLLKALDLGLVGFGLK